MIGQYNYNLDPKKRLTIPTKFRGDLTDGAVLTKGVDGCLFLYPKKQWEDLAGKISNQPYITQSNVRSISREIIAQATDVNLDSLGRI
jgi:MraZ protein